MPGFEIAGAMLLLGAMHGINPAMGWLFAVGLGFQEQSRRAVWRALGPMALGHAIAVALAIVLAGALGLVVPAPLLKWLVAATLLGFGMFHLLRHRHPRWGGMRVGARDLTIWSFLMASAHGAGVMILPFVLGAGAAAGDDPHAAHLAAIEGTRAAADGVPLLAAGAFAGETTALLAAAIHTAGYLLMTGLIAVIVYEKLGLRRLRDLWLNLNVVWAAALVVTAVLTIIG